MDICTSKQDNNRHVKQTDEYVKKIDKLFRRVRDKYANLQLSKNSKAYYPGQGVYRSSVKNTQSLTRSEINIAYRTADYKQYNRWDFVLGYEIHRANREDNYPCDICERLKGIYQKEFQFVGWHPHCRCYTTMILPTREEFKEYQKQKLQAEIQGKSFNYVFKGTVKDLPENFQQYYNENKDKIATYKQKPYWLADNERLIYRQETKNVINNVYDYVKDIQAKNKNFFHSQSLVTGKMKITYRIAKAFMQKEHTRTLDDKKLLLELGKNANNLKLVKDSFSPLDMNKTANNLKAKQERGVTGYRQYEYTNAKGTYIILFEERHKKFEVPYCIVTKNNVSRLIKKKRYFIYRWSCWRGTLTTRSLHKMNHRLIHGYKITIFFE